MKMSFTHPLGNVPEGQLESLDGLMAQYKADTRPYKVDLMCGVYRTDMGEPFVFPSIKMARQMLFFDPDWNHEYPPSHLGDAAFRDLSARLQFGDDSVMLAQKRLASMQALGASGALHMGAKFLRAHYEPYLSRPESKVYIPHETWSKKAAMKCMTLILFADDFKQANHPNAFQSVGFPTASLPWYDRKTRAFDFALFQSAICDLPSQSIIVLQVSANNPTGCDPSVDEWRQIADTFKRLGHFAFLDLAYPGFVSGCFVTDTLALRIFAEAEVPLAVATTYGKAFGLYGERVGHLCLVLPDTQTAQRAEQQMKLLARAETGAQPRFGAELVALILGNAELKGCWEKEIRRLAQDLIVRRRDLKEMLVRGGASGDWDFITKQGGMFTFTSFTTKQIDRLREEFAVYIQDTGRLSIAGLSSRNLAYVASSIAKTTQDDQRRD